jgi:F-type H+-transporting ATPase subunit b
MELIKPEMGLVFWTVVTFVLLLVVLKRLAWKPLLKLLEEREITIKNFWEQAEKAKSDAESHLGQSRSQLAETKKRIAEMFETGKREAEKLKNELAEKAAEEARGIVQKGKLELENEKSKAAAELKATTVDLALAAAEKLIQSTLREDGHRKLVLQAVEDLGKVKEK